MTPENKFLTDLVPALDKAGCEVKNMHGNEFQSGIPDRLVVRPAGRGFAFFEAKVIPRAKVLTQAQVQASLRPEQKKNVAKWAHGFGCVNNLYVAVWNPTRNEYHLLRGVDLPPIFKPAMDVPLPDYTLEEVVNAISGRSEFP